MSLGAALKRLGLLAAGAVTCAVLACFAALYVQTKTLPPTDAAHEQPLLQTVADPFVLYVALGVGLELGLFGTWIAALALWHVRLDRAVPLVTAVTVAVAALSAGVLSAPLAVAPTFGAAILTMLWCRRRAAWSLRPPELA